MKREKVYEAVDSERDFQDRLSMDETRPDMIEDFHVGDAISAIEYNITKARKAWYFGSKPHENAMKYMRKIAAIIVKQGEVNGMPFRDAD